MPSINHIHCHLFHPALPNSPFPELIPTTSSDLHSSTCYIPVPKNPIPSDDYAVHEVPYAIHWSIQPSLLKTAGLQVQIEVDGCQKAQPRCYEALGPDGLLPSSSLSGFDDGLWVVPDGTRRRPWILAPIKTTHPHSALADKYILDRVGSVQVTFRRATVVPTSHVVPLVPVFSGSAPLPDRLSEKISHWTKLGYIEKHPPPPELGLVAEEVHEVVASFTFYYRSEELLGRLLPSALMLGDPQRSIGDHLKLSFPSNCNSTTASDTLRLSFPGSPSPYPPLASVPIPTDRGSMHSSEIMSASLSEGAHAAPTRPGGGIRRAFSSATQPRHSVDGALPSIEKTQEKEEGGGHGRLSKLGGKRVRAVSLRVAKRYSLLGNKATDKSPSKDSSSMTADLTSTVFAIPATNDEVQDHLDTIEGLKKEVIFLRAEIVELKKHLLQHQLS